MSASSVVVLLAKVKSAGGSVSLSGDKAIARKIPKELLPELRSLKEEIKEYLMEATKGDTPEKACRTCAYRTAMRSCGDPVSSGLAETFEIRWHPNDGTDCSAWMPKQTPTDDEIIWIGNESYIAVRV